MVSVVDAKPSVSIDEWLTNMKALPSAARSANLTNGASCLGITSGSREARRRVEAIQEDHGVDPLARRRLLERFANATSRSFQALSTPTSMLRGWLFHLPSVLVRRVHRCSIRTNDLLGCVQAACVPTLSPGSNPTLPPGVRWRVHST